MTVGGTKNLKTQKEEIFNGQYSMLNVHFEEFFVSFRLFVLCNIKPVR